MVSANPSEANLSRKKPVNIIKENSVKYNSAHKRINVYLSNVPFWVWMSWPFLQLEVTGGKQ